MTASATGICIVQRQQRESGMDQAQRLLVPWADARIHVNAVGHASAIAIFEGIKAHRATAGGSLLLFRLDEHLPRFYDSARLCRLHLPYERRNYARRCARCCRPIDTTTTPTFVRGRSRPV
jgi:branched-subunit amino acid aminotransferase/4-amino-4-deoxychorismate lyase